MVVPCVVAGAVIRTASTGSVVAAALVSRAIIVAGADYAVIAAALISSPVVITGRYSPVIAAALVGCTVITASRPCQLTRKAGRAAGRATCYKQQGHCEDCDQSRNPCHCCVLQVRFELREVYPRSVGCKRHNRGTV